MGLCSCSSSKCACAVVSGSGIKIKGNGTDRNPYIPEAAFVPLIGSAKPDGPASVHVSGSGTPGDPWVVSIDTTGTSATQTVFTTGDTWMKQGGTLAHVIVIGGGGGGGHSAGNNFYGGGGGYGGNLSSSLFLIADLPDSVEIGVGAGGQGANSRTNPTGKAGGDSWFGDFLFAQGGAGGRAQNTPPVQADYVKPGGTIPEGGAGGFGAVRASVGGVVDAETVRDRIAPAGGGLGAGTSGNPSSPGGTIAPGDAGWAGDGGDGAPSTTGPGGPFPGEDGGLYGGGGGGGYGGGTDSRGGDGAPGVVVVTVW